MLGKDFASLISALYTFKPFILLSVTESSNYIIIFELRKSDIQYVFIPSFLNTLDLPYGHTRLYELTATLVTSPAVF